jgi:hypothetical protein
MLPSVGMTKRISHRDLLALVDGLAAEQDLDIVLEDAEEPADVEVSEATVAYRARERWSVNR